MIDPTVYMAAMWISEVWYAGFEQYKDKPKWNRFSTRCRAMGIVRFDQVMLGRIKVVV